MPIVSFEEFLSAKLDYLIIGGGTSGIVVATRLAENTDSVVGVVEAGEYHETDPEVNIPGMMGRSIHNPKFDWTFYSVPQKHANDRTILQSRGKGLGGSSMLNFLASVRPAKEELDAFEELGNPGWNWDTILEYMKKSEHLDTPALSPEEAALYSASPDPSLHGTNGPIAKSFPCHIPSIHSKLLDSLANLNSPRNFESSGGRPVGSFLFPTSVDSTTATRSYAASAYYAPNATRKNLLVLTGAYATKIHLKADAAVGGLQQATGAEIVKGGKTATINASKEVILSTGAFQTPQLLELSGIGNANLLRSFGIDCVVELPGVGENLQDHALTPTIVEVDKTIESIEILRDPVGLEKHEVLYQQKGILAGIPSSIFAFLPSNVLGTKQDVQSWISHATTDSASAEVFSNTHSSVKRGISKQFEIMRRWIDNSAHPLVQLLNFNGHFPIPGLEVDPQKRYMTLLCAYTHPFTRGTVHITSATDPYAHPAIQQNYLSNPADLDILVKGLKFVMKLCKTRPVADLVVGEVLPGLGTAEADKGEVDEEMLKEYVRNSLGTVHHPVGTAAMLPRDDGGVVDSKLLVYGTSNLRVVDCSIIPLLISSNIQTLAYAIGEKAADIILKCA